MKYLLFLLLIFSFWGCKEKPKNKYDEAYVIINELLRFNYYDTDLVVLKLKSNQKNYSFIDCDSVGELPPPPPSINNTYYNKCNLKELSTLGLIDSIDVNYMFNQIDSSVTFTLDSTKIDCKTILQAEDFKSLGEKYNAHDYVIFSVPLISKDNNKILMEVEYYCGSLCGKGKLYLFEKINGKWKIKHIELKWVS